MLEDLTPTFGKIWSGIRTLFYLSLPHESSFETVEEVPSYLLDAFPYFIALIILESIVLFLQGKTPFRHNDALNSVTCGMYDMLPMLLMRSFQVVSYIWFYDKFNIITLSWDSPLTWFLCFLGVDFGYYWAHRFGHEVNIMWASHQAHHSSEDYNLTTALRQSAFQRTTTWVFYLPLALFIPPSVVIVHTQFNLLFQFWIHTETIGNLGPLEWIINTPSHHRVHHGRNRYCIDKNYGGTLIIFDRMFGTFESEKEKVVYGLVHPLSSWDPIYAQICHYLYIWTTFWKVEGIENKLSVLFKGPGWEPGKPRLGLKEDIPEIQSPVQKYDKDLPVWGKVYILFHFFWIVGFYFYLGTPGKILSVAYRVSMVIFMFLSLYGFGAMYDHRHFAAGFEFLRCFIFFLAQNMSPLMQASIYLPFVNVTFVISAVLWLLICIESYTIYHLKFKVS